MDETQARILPFGRPASDAPDAPAPQTRESPATSEAERLRYWAQLRRLRAERQGLAG